MSLAKKDLAQLIDVLSHLSPSELEAAKEALAQRKKLLEQAECAYDLETIRLPCGKA